MAIGYSKIDDWILSEDVLDGNTEASVRPLCASWSLAITTG